MSEQHNTVAFTKVAGPTCGKTGARFEWSVTVRADDPDDLITKLGDYEKKLITAGCIPMDAYIEQRRTERANQSQPPAQPGQPAPPPSEPQPQNGNGHKIGTGRLQQIIITAGADGKIKAEFHVEGLRYPLKDARGPAAVAALFDQSLQWETGHFASPTVYVDGRDFNNLLLDWAKPDKYYNVVKIYQG